MPAEDGRHVSLYITVSSTNLEHSVLSRVFPDGAHHAATVPFYTQLQAGSPGHSTPLLRSFLNSPALLPGTTLAFANKARSNSLQPFASNTGRHELNTALLLAGLAALVAYRGYRDGIFSSSVCLVLIFFGLAGGTCSVPDAITRYFARSSYKPLAARPHKRKKHCLRLAS